MVSALWPLPCNDGTSAAPSPNSMKIDPRHFRFAGGKPLTLAKWPTLTDPVYKSQKDYKKLLQAQVSELN